MNEHERAEVERIASDSESGASALVHRAAMLLLSTAQRTGGNVREVAAACVAAQPSMAGMLSLAAAVSDSSDAQTIERFVAGLRRAPERIAAHAVPLLLLGAATNSAGRPALTIVTCSGSGAVQATLLALARRAEVIVRCSESRPRLEGAALATDLAGAEHLQVEMFTDAGLSSAIADADAVLVGADAVGEEQFVNKVGTAALCALATQCGVPVYVLAGREKRLSPLLFSRVSLKSGPPSEILLPESAHLASQPVRLRNPYFEYVSLSLVSYLISDSGAVSR